MRHLKDFLTSYVQYTEGQESPDIFHMWCAISIVAATLARNVYIDRAYYKLFPNFYIVLVGGSASVRKSTAIHIAERLHQKALPDSPRLSQKITTESLILTLKEALAARQEAVGYIVADELSVFLGSSARDSGLIQLLTKVYDCPDNFEYRTIVRGKEICNFVCCNMLGGTVPDWIKTSLPIHAIGGGFTGRIMFIYQDKCTRRFAFPIITAVQRDLEMKLKDDLIDISKIKGEYSFTPDAHEYYERWYEEAFNPDAIKDSGLQGYFGRKPDTVLKLALVMSASQDGGRLINEVDIASAIRIINENEKALPDTIRMIQSNELGEIQMKVLQSILRAGTIDRSSLLRSLTYCLNATGLDDIIHTLLVAGVIEENLSGGKTFYSKKK